MTQNIYDDPDFQSGYSGLPRSVEGLAGAPEWPALRALLPDPRGRRVVDLGCGYGWFCRWVCEEGAAEVLGLDVSENMLARARADTSDAAIRYAGADLEAFTLPAAAFDLAYSSLTFHYIADLGRLFASIHQALVPGGRLVFSIEHPIFMVPTHPVWSAGTDGRAVWPLDGYLAEGQRVTEWFAPGVIKYHRTLGTTLNLLIGSGFSVRHIEEWGPTEAQIAAKPEWVKERERPMFLIIAAER
jgi:SAM-dependent methyltransferase